MSAWYVLSALGFYPVTPGSGNYMVGSPQFSLATINLENEKTFIINAPGVSTKNYYIQNALLSTTASLRPKPWDAAYLKDYDIANGGLVTFMMGDKPSKTFSTVPFTTVPTLPTDQEIVVNPVINGGAVPFKGNKQVVISSTQKGNSVFYTLDGTEPTVKSKRYISALTIDRSVTLKAIAVNKKGKTSFVTTAVYKKIPHNYTVNYLAKYEKQYDGGGPDGLIDGLRGTINWRKGNWQGYQKTDMDVVIDLKAIKQVSKISIDFLQDTRAWIIMPKKLVIETSLDGKNFTPLYSGEDFLPIEKLDPQIMILEPSFAAVKARYVRIKAIQYGKLPEWHLGAGGDSHIFVDEVEIK